MRSRCAFAACEARHALIALGAAKELNVSGRSELEARDGAVRVKSDPSKSVSYGSLIGDRAFSIDIEVTEKTLFGPKMKGKSALKSPKDYRVVGQSIPRFDVPEKVTGVFEFVHNVRVPGMLHGRVVRLPSVGAKLVSVDESSIAGIPDVRVVRKNDFLGVVAKREEYAIKAAQTLRANWQEQVLRCRFAERAYETLRKQLGAQGHAVVQHWRHGERDGEGPHALQGGVRIPGTVARHDRAVLRGRRRHGRRRDDLVGHAVAARHTQRHGEDARSDARSGPGDLPLGVGLLRPDVLR